jgi:signal transduction histidine kinase
MKRFSPRTVLRAPVFAQLMALVLVSLVAAQAINIAIVFFLPPPPPEMFSLGEVAAALKAGGTPVRAANEHTLSAHLKSAPTGYQRGRPSFREAVAARGLADALGAPPDKVHVVLLNRPPGPTQRRRFGSDPDHRPAYPQFDGRLPPRGFLPAAQERFIMAPFEASLQRADGQWMSVRAADSGLLNSWQQRVLLCFALSAVILIPIVYAFARRLAQPITAFARAAERLGRDPGAPPVEIDGPAEVETAAVAFNEMQERLRRYVTDRTAMVGAVAHDMRTPLTRLRFRIEATPEPLRSKIIADIDQMDAMISSAMAFVRDASDPVERRRLELVSLVESVADEMAETGLKVSAEGAGPVVIHGDPIGLRRLVTNLMDNAVKFAGSAHARVYADGGQAVVEVDDDGPGVPDHERERVFEPFQRGEPSRSRATGGSGLGLAVVRSVARAHGGEATIENRAEGGLRARASLPL